MLRKLIHGVSLLESKKMPKFKRLPKSAKPFKFELEEDFTITPRFDREFWYGHDGCYLCCLDGGSTVNLGRIENGQITYFSGGKNNGLTCHRDHSWALPAAHAHDILLLENYPVLPLNKEELAIADRVFLSVLLDHVDKLKGFKKVLYKSFAYAMYWAVRANSIIKGER